MRTSIRTSANAALVGAVLGLALISVCIISAWLALGMY
jgi:hypothetical protein